MNFKTLRIYPIVFICFTSFILSGCAIYEIQEIEPLDQSKRWIMLPVINHADTPEAGERVADIAVTLLRTKGLNQLDIYTQAETNQALPELNQKKLLATAITLSAQKGYQYAVTGSVQEWRYKSGLDAEPVAGITLTVIDLASKKMLWSASGSKTGWGRDSVSGVAHQVLEVLIDGLAITE